MDTKTLEGLEGLILVSWSQNEADRPRKEQATEVLNKLRGSDERWEIGLKMFFEASSQEARFFGLSLVRDYMQSNIQISVEQRKSIRDAMLRWMSDNILSGGLSSETRPKAYLINNAVSVLTLCIKFDYPEIWSSAFDDILGLGNSSIAGLDLTVRILMDLDIEVVTAFESNIGASSSTKEHHERSTMIKDAMRAGNVTRSVINLLSKSAVLLRSDGAIQQQHGLGVCNALSRRCLRCMSSFVVWMDVNVVLQDTLATLFQALRDPILVASSLACLFELVKKGMDPLMKAHMINTIDIVPVLLSVPLENIDAVSNEANYADDEVEENHIQELGSVVNIVVCELLSCWTKFGDLALAAQTQSQAVDQGAMKDVCDVAPHAARNLHILMPRLLEIFSIQTNMEASSRVLPAVNRLVTHLKIEKERRQNGELQLVMNLFSQHCPQERFFQILEYYPSMLGTVYRQLQYQEDFDFDPDDDEAADVMEAKKMIRKLFVNCCRIAPEPCLELIQAAFQALSQPLSSSPMGPLEAAVQLAHSFSEANTDQHAALVQGGSFPELINALHASNISEHAHPQVLLIYFELCVRYLNLCTPQSLQRVAEVLSGPRGIRNPDAAVRARAAYSMKGVADGFEFKAYLLLPHVNNFADIILNACGSQILEHGQESPSLLTKSSQLHLLEATAHITKCRSAAHFVAPLEKATRSHAAYKPGQALGSTGPLEPPVIATADQEVELRALHQQQLQMLGQLLDILTKQLESLASHPEIARYGPEIAELAAHKVSSIAGLAIKSSTTGKNLLVDASTIASLFEPSCRAVIAACHTLGAHACVRKKVCMFLHRMVGVLGSNCMDLLGHMYPLLLQHGEASDSDQIVQLLNQTMGEYKERACHLVDALFAVTCDKFQMLIHAFEQSQADNKWIAEQSSKNTFASLGIAAAAAPQGVKEAPHVAIERASLQRQYFQFLSHVCQQHVDQILLSAANSPRLETILAHMLQGIRGVGVRGIVKASQIPGTEAEQGHLPPILSHSEGLQIRKQALASIVGLTKAWHAGAQSDAVTPQLVAAFRSYLFEQVLPLVLGGMNTGYLDPSTLNASPELASQPAMGANGKGSNEGQGHVMLNMKDPQSISVLGEAAVLVHTIVGAHGREEVANYLQQGLPVFGWGPQASAALVQLVVDPHKAQSQVDFKEQYKEIVRACIL